MNINLTNYFNKRKQAFLKIAESEEGKIFLGDIYRFCESKDPVVPNDPLSTGKNIGKELVAKHIKKVLYQDDKYVQELINLYTASMSRKP